MAFKVKKIREIEEPFFLRGTDEQIGNRFMTVIGTGVGSVFGMLMTGGSSNNVIFNTGAVIGGTLGFLAVKRFQDIGKTVYDIEGKKIVADNKQSAIETYKLYLKHKNEPHKFHLFHFKNNNKVAIEK